MKTFILLAICLTCVEFSSAFSLESKWNEFKDKHAKSYKNKAEEKLRFTHWSRRVEQVEKLNKRPNMTFTAQVTKLHDYLPEELKSLTGLIPAKTVPKSTYKALSASLPSSFDWRNKSAITPVKNQGSCGSCWAFAAAGALEAQLYLKTGKLTLLSEQEFVDCVSGGVSNGCNGGNSDEAYAFAKKGIASSSAYPYVSGSTQRANSCSFNSGNSIASTRKDKSSQFVSSNDESLMKDALVNGGPLSVYVCANSLWFAYAPARGQKTVGVLTDSPCDGSNEEHSINHVVLIVGYGTDSKAGDYWIIKNSWDTWWGESGYIRLARNKGLVHYASYPLLN